MNLNQTSFVSYVSWGIGIRTPCQHQWRPSQKGHPGHQKYQKDSVGVATNCRIPMVSVPCVRRCETWTLPRRKLTRPVRKTEENSTGLPYLVSSLISDLQINFQWISGPRLVWCLPFQVFHALGWLSLWFADWPTTTSPCFHRADVT